MCALASPISVPNTSLITLYTIWRTPPLPCEVDHHYNTLQTGHITTENINAKINIYYAWTQTTLLYLLLTKQLYWFKQVDNIRLYGLSPSRVTDIFIVSCVQQSVRLFRSNFNLKLDGMIHSAMKQNTFQRVMIVQYRVILYMRRSMV